MTQQQNEAACLLEKGALYTRRAGLLWEGRELVFAGFKQGAFSLYFGDSPVYHFDLEGRWQRAYFRERHYLRRLDGAVIEVDRVREGTELVIRRRTLEPAEAHRIDEEVRAVADGLLADLDAGRGDRIAPPDGAAGPIVEAELREFLERIVAWDASAWRDLEARYARAYPLPIPPLPPDCPNAVVLQASNGDRDGRTFAGASAHGYGVLDPDGFDDHVREVSGLLGRRLAQSRSAFLGGADVLRLPGPDVIAYLDIVRHGLSTDDGPAIDDVHAFLDDFQEPVADAETLRAARERRLTRIALGVESGAPEVRRLYGKDWCDPDLQAFAADAKAAGVELSVMALVGAGGRDRRDEHVERTIRLIESLLLTRGDLVFLLDEREYADPVAVSRGFEPLADEEWLIQRERLRQGLSGLRERGVKVVPYSLVKQFA